jgi:peptide chain release factor 2
MKMLTSKLYALKLLEKEKEFIAKAGEKTAIAWGYQIRSYVLQPYQMVKDLRTGCESGNALGILEGDIDVFLESTLAFSHK